MTREKKRPFFTIITVCYNAGSRLQKTINSVQKQSFQDWEMIIKDGKSNDGSIEKLLNVDNRVKIIVEKDTGIYNAMNRAISEAKGELIIFLNAGDVFSNDKVLENVSNIYHEKKADIYYGDYINATGDYCIVPSKITFNYMYRSFICHQTIFYKSDLMIMYDDSFQLLADHNLNLSMLADKKVFYHMPFDVCIYEGGGMSENPKYRKIYMAELKRIRHTYFSILDRYINTIKYYLTFPHVRKYLSGKNSPVVLRKLYRNFVSFVRKD